MLNIIQKINNYQYKMNGRNISIDPSKQLFACDYRVRKGYLCEVSSVLYATTKNEELFAIMILSILGFVGLVSQHGASLQ
jgi:hypothetical protein